MATLNDPIVGNKTVFLFKVKMSIKIEITKKKHKEKVDLGIRDIEGISESEWTKVDVNVDVTNADCIDAVSTKSFNRVWGNSLKGKEVK